MLHCQEPNAGERKIVPAILQQIATNRSHHTKSDRGDLCEYREGFRTLERDAIYSLDSGFCGKNLFSKGYFHFDPVYGNTHRIAFGQPIAVAIWRLSNFAVLKIEIRNKAASTLRGVPSRYPAHLPFHKVLFVQICTNFFQGETNVYCKY